MRSLLHKRAWGRPWLPACAGLLLILAAPGCQTAGFYSQAILGQYEILARQRTIAQLLKDPGADPKLKARLELVLRLRQFAARELKLRPDGSYLAYADLHRPAAAWNVNVAPPLSLEPKTWWFPVVGRASYRGYFHEAAARRYAARWAKKGWDTYVDDVPAYSTLGWFHDPLLNTFIFESEADLADTIFHELTHQLLFVPGDTDFNEALAMTVASEGVRRWFAASANTPAYQRYQAGLQHENDFVRLIMAARQDLHKVYHDAQLPDAAKLRRKAEIIEETRRRYAKLKATWGVGTSGYDDWFGQPINNAQLNTVAAYYDLQPAFQALLRAQGGDMEKFFDAARALAKLPLAKRHEALVALLQPKETNSH
jgi:predicted aminopeptidase